MSHELLANDWLVFVDGVQVPWISISIQFPMDGIGQGQLILEPDVLLTRVRARAVIAVFARDRFSEDREYESESDRILAEYFYFGGGEVTAINSERQAHGRDVTLQFEADLGVLHQHRCFASGIGGNPYYGTVNGSTFIRPEDEFGTGLPQDTLSVALLARTFSTGDPSADPTKHRSDGSSSEDMGNRLSQLLSFLSAHNASLRVQSVRTRLLNKIAAVDDNVLSSLAKVSLSGHMFNLVQNQVTSEDSIFEMMMKFASALQYHITTIPAPPVPEDQPDPGTPDKVPFPPHLGGDGSSLERFKFRREWYRNDYVFVPNLYYSAPPPCNFIFPDMLGSRSTTRNFMNEPTRSHYTDYAFKYGGAITFVEPVDIVQGEAGLLTPADFWAIYKDLTTPNSNYAGATDSAYRAGSSLASQGVDLLQLLQDDELEKGIISHAVPQHSEYMLALARSLDLKNPDGTYKSEELANLADVVANAFTSSGGSDDAKAAEQRNYVQFVQLWLRYHHQLARFHRPSSVILKGHRWLVPGFSTVIFDQDMVFMSYITGVSYTIGSDGTEATTVNLDHTRPISPVRVSELTGLNATVNDVRQIRTSLNDQVQTAYVNDSLSYQTRLQHMMSNYAAIQARQEEFEAASSLEQSRIQRELSSFVRAYSQDYREILVRTRSYANAVNGSKKGLPGALIARRNPGLASSLLVFLDPSVQLLEPAAFSNLSSSLNQAREAVSLIEQFNQAQVDQYMADEPAHAETSAILSTINTAVEEKRKQSIELERQIQKLESEVDFPTPPLFYNQDFIKLDRLDAQYQDLLGCKPFYTGKWGKGIEVSLTDDDSNDVRRATAYLEHQKMVAMFSRVFESTRRAVREDESTTVSVPQDESLMSWDEVIKSDLGSVRWQHEEFLKRRAQTLGSYLRTHGFEETLEVQISDEPTPTIFYRMRPKNPTQVGALTWDNSVVCRLVDELARTGETILLQNLDPDVISVEVIDTRVTPLDGVPADGFYLVRTRSDNSVETEPVSGQVVPTGVLDLATLSDPLIENRRRQAQNPFLTSDVRQGVILAYSRRHFGSRGIDGK